MGRYYHLSKRPAEAERAEILREMRELDGLAEVEILADSKLMKVLAEEDKYPEVMARAVNICRRIAGGMELSFAGFAMQSEKTNLKKA